MRPKEVTPLKAGTHYRQWAMEALFRFVTEPQAVSDQREQASMALRTMIDRSVLRYHDHIECPAELWVCIEREFTMTTAIAKARAMAKLSNCMAQGFERLTDFIEAFNSLVDARVQCGMQEVATVQGKEISTKNLETGADFYNLRKRAKPWFITY